MKRRIVGWGIVALALAGCDPGGASSPGSRGAEDATRANKVDSTHDSQSGGGATDMRGSGRGGEHRPEKH